jgi:uncharacterized protein YbcI
VPDRPGGELLAALCGETVALMRRYWGKGPTKCRAFAAGHDTILLLLADGFTAAEQTVSDAGHAEKVIAFRSTYHDVMNEKMTEIVERLFGRRVQAAMNASHASPDLTALIFVLAPEGET